MFNPKKLNNSKWTAVKPSNKERHFMVTKLKLDEEGQVLECVIEALMSKRTVSIDYRELSDSSQWFQGWK